MYDVFQQLHARIPQRTQPWGEHCQIYKLSAVDYIQIDRDRSRVVPSGTTLYLTWSICSFTSVSGLNESEKTRIIMQSKNKTSAIHASDVHQLGTTKNTVGGQWVTLKKAREISSGSCAQIKMEIMSQHGISPVPCKISCFTITHTQVHTLTYGHTHAHTQGTVTLVFSMTKFCWMLVRVKCTPCLTYGQNTVSHVKQVPKQSIGCHN